MLTMKGEFDLFRDNLRREFKRTTLKAVQDKSGVWHSTLSELMAGKREFRESHMQGISEALGVPLAKLFASQAEIDQRQMEGAIMEELRECIELMLVIPEFRRGILARCDELKRMFKAEVDEALKKKSMGKRPIL